MPSNIQRFLPIILIAFVLLIVLPAIFRKSSTSSAPNARTLSGETIGATSLVDKGEVAFRAAHHSYSAHVADLLELERPLGHDLGDGVVVTVDASADGTTYYAHVTSTNLALVRARNGAKVIESSCIVVKSGSGVACPAAPKAATTTSSTASTSTTTTTTSSG